MTLGTSPRHYEHPLHHHHQQQAVSPDAVTMTTTLDDLLSPHPEYHVTGEDGDVRHNWDINDVTFHLTGDTDDFLVWPDGNVKAVYRGDGEEAKRHHSGWAMRNTNNHNVAILKKSCLGVLLCSKACLSSPSPSPGSLSPHPHHQQQRQPVYVRPAICDKARKKQCGKPCPNPSCDGVLVIQPCKGHAGYPVTHFWRHITSDLILFQAKGVHDHPMPEFKALGNETKRRRVTSLHCKSASPKKRRTHSSEPITFSDDVTYQYKMAESRDSSQSSSQQASSQPMSVDYFTDVTVVQQQHASYDENISDQSDLTSQLNHVPFYPASDQQGQFYYTALTNGYTPFEGHVPFECAVSKMTSSYQMIDSSQSHELYSALAQANDLNTCQSNAKTPPSTSSSPVSCSGRFLLPDISKFIPTANRQLSQYASTAQLGCYDNTDFGLAYDCLPKTVQYVTDDVNQYFNPIEAPPMSCRMQMTSMTPEESMAYVTPYMVQQQSETLPYMVMEPQHETSHYPVVSQSYTRSHSTYSSDYVTYFEI